MHLVKVHPCCPTFLAQPIRRDEKFCLSSKLAIYGQKCKLRKRQTDRLATPYTLWHVSFSVSVLYSLLLRGDKRSSPPPALDNSFPQLIAARSAVSLTCLILDIAQLLWHIPFSVSILYDLLLCGDKRSSPPRPLDNSFPPLIAACSAVSLTCLILDIAQLIWHVPFSVSVLYSLLLRGDKRASPPTPLDN
jgi:hypothetical protein